MTKIRNKKLLKFLESAPEDARFNLPQLMEEQFLNFQFEDQYGFGNHPNKGLIRKRIITLLFEIHAGWKAALEKLDQPYYLAIWLCEPQIIRSEVVCAVGDRIKLYSDHWFDASEKDPVLRKEAYGKNQHLFDQLIWERKNAYTLHTSVEMNWPLEHYKDPKQFYKDRRFYAQMEKTCKKITEETFGKTYYQLIGDYWVGKHVITPHHA